MTHYADSATLRAYLDGELPEAEREEIADHLAGCETCAARLDEVRALDATVVGAFVAAGEGATPSADAAFARLRESLPRDAREVRERVSLPSHRVSRRRPALAGLGIAAALVLALMLPSVRGAAAAFLQTFRANSVIFVSVNPNRVQQLQHLQVDPNSLFLSKPQRVGAAPAQQQVSSLGAASTATGLTVQAPRLLPLPASTTTYTVEGQSSYTMQVNVQTLQAALTSLGVTDVTIPSQLGEHPISITLSPSVELKYVGDGYTMSLIEGTSPTVSLPDGVDLSQLGKAALEVYGMPSQQADTLSKQIDWRSTLVFPFPVGMTRIQQVNINGAQGVMLNAPTSDTSNNRTRSEVVYWQSGTQFYVLQVDGNAVGDTDVLATASSVK